MKPVSVVNHESAINPEGWQFAFEFSNELSDGVERAASKLLNELLYVVIAYRNDLPSIAAVTREHAEVVCAEIESAKITTIHGAVIWCYGLIGDLLGLEFNP